jgi:hypothetical protein
VLVCHADGEGKIRGGVQRRTCALEAAIFEYIAVTNE